jgi:hypothetical protein
MPQVVQTLTDRNTLATNGNSARDVLFAKGRRI